MGTEKVKRGRVSGPRSFRLRRFSAFLLPLTVCLSLGCKGGGFFDRERDDRPDPLTGLDRIPPSRRNVSVTSNPGDNRTPAALAASRDGVSGLGIRDSEGDAAPSRDRPVQTTGWTGSRSDDNPGTAKLGSPTTGGPTGSRSSPPAATATGRIRTFEDAQQFLIARGVKAQELRQRDGEWSFSCSVPIRNKENSMKTYEASDRYGLLAIQKVIDKMKSDGDR